MQGDRSTALHRAHRKQDSDGRQNHNAAGTEPAPNPALVDELATEMTQAPSDFARRDLVPQIAHLPLPQWQRFRDWQAGLRSNEVLTLDVLRKGNQNPDGAEVYSEFVDGKGSSFGTTYQPEASRPVRRRLMTIKSAGVAADGTAWYSAKIRMIRMIDGPVDDMFDDRVYTFQATDFDAAFDRAIAIGREEESSFVNWDDQRVQWRLAEVLSLNLVGSGELGHAVDVHSEPVPMAEADRVPFDTAFHPERSKPGSTGV